MSVKGRSSQWHRKVRAAAAQVVGNSYVPHELLRFGQVWLINLFGERKHFGRGFAC